MSHIGDLIRQHCPDGVPYKTLGEVGSFNRGSGLQKKDFTETGFPCIHYGQIYTYYGISATQTKSFISPAQAARLHRAQPGDLIIATTSENDEDLCKAVAWLGDGEVAVSNDACFYHHELHAKYVSYWIQSTDFQRQKDQWITGTKVRRVSVRNLERALIPVPPLPVQEEIVRILDSFTKLEAELEAELEARRQQYAYYRRRLVLRDEGVEQVRLGDIATIGTGKHDTKDAVPDGKYAFFARGREPLRLDSFDFDERAIITAGDGVGVGNVFHFASGKYALHQRAYRIVPHNDVNARFLYHYLLSDFSHYLERTSVHASVTSLRRPMFLKYPVRLPSLDVQNGIVATLDTFDSLANDLSSGLLAEIAARRQQYEYYRDRLLTFKVLAA